MFTLVRVTLSSSGLIALLLPLILPGAAPFSGTGDNTCNGRVTEVPVEGPYPEMTCEAIDCEHCGDPDSLQLDVNTVLYWCECDPAGEPSCCHTIQKKINGVYQVPTAWGKCRGALDCPGTCMGSAFAGFKCQ